MKSTLSNIKLVKIFFIIILFLPVFSCSDKEVKPFLGEKNKYTSIK